MEPPVELISGLAGAKAPIAETTAHFVDRLGTGVTTGDELRSTELDLERDRVAVLLEVAGAALEVLKHTLIEKAELAIRNAALQNVMVQAQAVALNAAPRLTSPRWTAAGQTLLLINMRCQLFSLLARRCFAAQAF